jgi:hypothetical protein
MSEPILVFGQGGGNSLFEAGLGYTDDGVAYEFRGRSDRVAPAGINGECIFPALYLAISHTMAVDLIVVPVVDEVELDPITLSLTAKTVRTLERFDIGLSVPILDGLDVERGRCAPRGCWFQLLVYDDGLAAGDLVFEQTEVEFEAVESSIVSVGP